MSSKLCYHIIEPHRIGDYDPLVVVSHAGAKVVGGPGELGILSYYHEKNPSAMYTARIWDYEQAIRDMLATGKSAADTAGTMYNLLHNFVHAAGMEWCWFECGVNEPNIDEDDDTLMWIDDYYANLIPMLAADGIRSISYNFSVCHPEFSAWQKLSRSLATIRRAGPLLARVGLHEYGGINGDIRTDADTQILRHRRIAELQTIPIAITECGREPGWQQIHRSAEDYLADLLWLDQELQRDGNVIATYLYTMDMDPEWWAFRIEGNLATGLFEYITAQNASIVEILPTPPTPPTGSFAVSTLCSAGQNIRRYPSYKGQLVGEIVPGETGYTSLDERLSIGQEASWVKIKTATAEGWAAAWLLKVA
jgi:hypothetical protein